MVSQQNPYRHIPTTDLMAAAEINKWDLASLELEPESWEFASESRSFVVWHVEAAQAEIARRERLRSNRFAPEWPDPRRELDNLRVSIDIQTLIERVAGVAFREAGSRRWTACMLPSHTDDETPSFSVNPDKGVWFCFGCQRGGDHFRWVELYRDVDFHEAVDVVARAAGVARPTPRPKIVTMLPGVSFTPVRGKARRSG